jgi:predicted TIM-barrel fold metal-dependent hydrolase
MRVIAVEEHCVTPELRALLGAQIHPYYPANQWPPALERRMADIGAGRIAEMDAAGIDMQVLSTAQPGLEHAPGVEATPVAQAFNEGIAAAIERHPDRFAGFAALPTADPAAAALELERAVTELRLNGAMVNGRTRERFLDDQFFWPIFETAEALGVALYLHPMPPPRGVYDLYFAGFGDDVGFSFASGAWGWHVETGMHAVRLMLAGVFDRFPALQVILGHMGEVLPFMLARTTNVLRGSAALGAIGTKMELTITEYVRRNVHISISGFFSDPPLRCALDTIGVDRIMFAVDHPFGDDVAGRRFLDEATISEEEREKIAHVNAERLLRLREQQPAP